METRISDVVEPTVFTDYVHRRTMKLSAFLESGVMTTNDVLRSKASSGGTLVTMPFWNDLSDAESRIGSDDPAVKATHQKITAAADLAVVHERNQSWSEMDLAVHVAGDDPLKGIGDRVSKYWSRHDQNKLLSSLLGVMASNVTNNSGDMVFSIYNDTATPTSSNYISASAVVNAAQTMGDAKTAIRALAVHSVVHARLQEQDLIETVQPAGQDLSFETYLGKRLIIDDGLPVIAGTNAPKYLSILFGENAIGFGEGMVKTPTAVVREEDAGNGAGQEILYFRRRFLLHPMGIKFVASPAAISPSAAELEDGASWSRVRPERKMVPIAFLETN